MIPKKARAGTDTAGLLVYLYGPGKRDEHVDAHMVAAWDAAVEDPARSPEMTISDLALLLDAPVYALMSKKPAKHVYHVAVRNAPEDPLLTDAQWAEVAAEMMHAAGIAPHGDDQGCRWVAIRHAEDHIHIVATKARQDGRKPDVNFDIVRMQAAARRFETRWRLRRLVSGDKTAKIWPTTGETEKAAHRQLSETARDTLQRTVREAAAAATSEADFFARLGAAGVRVKQRIAPDGTVTGYSVALPGDRDRTQRAVWFSGTKLAPDLSLPRVRERWQGPPPAGRPATTGEVWQVAEDKVRRAAALLGSGGLAQGAGDVAALGDLLAVTAARSPELVREQLLAAAAEFERAGRAPRARELEGQSRELYRSSAQVLSMAVASSGRSDAAAMLGYLVALVEAVAAAHRWHEAQQARAQAQAARRAGRLLNEAVEITTGSAAARASRTGPRRGMARTSGGPRRTPGPGRGREGGELAALVHQAIPQHAPAVLSDAAWPALANRLQALADSGQDAAQVLAKVAGRRELTDAESVAEVLAWRLEGWTRQQGSKGAEVGKSAATRTPPGTGGKAGPAGGKAPAAGTRPTPGEQPKKGPRRAR